MQDRDRCLLLVVDDDRDILRTNRKYLETKGYAVHTAENAADALELLRRRRYDCILLDVMLPDQDGFTLCKEMRELADTPILFISCMDDEEAKVKGLLSGGDDYITKPYSLKEVAARVYAQVRRADQKRLRIDRDRQMVFWDDHGIALAQKEFDLFVFLFDHPGRIFPADAIYGRVWGDTGRDVSNTVAVYVKRLRTKLRADGDPFGIIETVRGEGYRFVPRMARQVEP